MSDIFLGNLKALSALLTSSWKRMAAGCIAKTTNEVNADPNSLSTAYDAAAWKTPDKAKASKPCVDLTTSFGGLAPKRTRRVSEVRLKWKASCHVCDQNAARLVGWSVGHVVQEQPGETC